MKEGVDPEAELAVRCGCAVGELKGVADVEPGIGKREVGESVVECAGE